MTTRKRHYSTPSNVRGCVMQLSDGRWILEISHSGESNMDTEQYFKSEQAAIAAAEQYFGTPGRT